jgi:single-stranded-DNA-specific exonuclease
MKSRLWKILSKNSAFTSIEEILNVIFQNRALSADSLSNFLKPTLQNINFSVGDIDKVVERLREAIKNKEKIIVYGDYDADGVTATAIMWEALYHLGANVKPYIPHREKEGYGISIIGLDYLIEKEQVDLIITVDQGISAKNQISYAQEKGIEVIVTDHHTKPPHLPENCLIVHDHTVSGAAVAWKVATKLLKSYEDEKTHNEVITTHTQLPLLSKQLLELVAIGIVCDLVPLIGESRVLVYYGLEQLRQTTRPGLLAIAKKANIDVSHLEVFQIGYVIGPRINAMGRLEHAMDALRLLCTKNQLKADELASKVNDVNTDRKELTQSLFNQARYQAELQKQHNLIVIGDETWNPGIIGLVASRIVEEYYKPTIVWGSSSEHKEILKASARSIKGFNIINAISIFSEHLASHGGHPMAAGFSVAPTQLQKFSLEIQKYADKEIHADTLIPNLEIDCMLPLQFATVDLYGAIQQLKPFGAQSEEPLFSSEELEVIDARAIGSDNKHLKLKVAQTGASYKPFDAIAFGFGEFSSKIRPGYPISLAYHVDLNVWNGKKNIQLKVRDIKV